MLTDTLPGRPVPRVSASCTWVRSYALQIFQVWHHGPSRGSCLRDRRSASELPRGARRSLCHRGRRSMDVTSCGVEVVMCGPSPGRGCPVAGQPHALDNQLPAAHSRNANSGDIRLRRSGEPIMLLRPRPLPRDFSRGRSSVDRRKIQMLPQRRGRVLGSVDTTFLQRRNKLVDKVIH